MHFTGRTEGSELRDDEFGVAVKGLALRRRPEIFQWVEHRHEHDSDDDHHSHKRVTYSYRRAAFSSLRRRTSTVVPPPAAIGFTFDSDIVCKVRLYR